MEIQDFSNYLIYNDGSVFSKKSNIFLKPMKDKDGYHLVNLYKNRKSKSFKIHRLVGLHYLPKVQGKDIIDHIDGDKINNHVNNLRWTTNIENSNGYQRLKDCNTSGFKNIIKTTNGFRFQKRIYGTKYQKQHKNLNELHWYKFVFLLQNI